MALVAKSGTPSLATTLPGPENIIAGLLAGETIAAGDAVYINSDGKVYRANGTAANAAARVRGFAAKAASSGAPVTILRDVTFNYGSNLTPGTEYYLATTPGGLDTAPTTGGTAPIAFAVDATRIRCVGNL